MDRILIHSDECLVYPGKYIPLPETDELLEQQKNYMKEPSVNIDEFDDFFRLEVSLPGIHREDIVVFVEDHILTVKVIHKNENVVTGKPCIHEFDMNYFERQITLPEEADTGFATAQYRDGILNLLVPKTAEHSKSHPGRIAIY